MKTIALRTKAAPRLRLAPGEDIFPELRPAGRITCRACGRIENVMLGHPALLCSACLVDVSATARRVADEYATAMVAFFDAGAALTKASQGNEWYAKTEAARGDMRVSPEIFALAWQRAKVGGGEKALLVSLRDSLDTTAEDMRAAELRYLAAAPELEAARAAMGEPINV
jgi:hypothetical protein